MLKMKKLVKLRVLEIKDISDEYINWLNDYEVVKFTNQKFLKHDYAKVRDFVRKMKKSKENILYGIYFDNTHVGNIKIGPIDFNNKNSQISYFLGSRKHWGLGIVSEAIRQILLIAKNDLKLKKISAYVVDKNIGSISVLKKNKFIYEGNLKKYFVMKNRRLDEYIYSKNL